MPTKDDRYSGLPVRIAKAARRRDEVNSVLRAACEVEYPVGSVVRVTLGRAEVTGRVVRHSDWDFGTVFIENVDTGKVRKFYATYHRAAVVER